MDDADLERTDWAEMSQYFPFPISARAELLTWLELTSAQSCNPALDPLEQFRAEVHRRIIFGSIKEAHPETIFQESLMNQLLAQVYSIVRAHITRVPNPQADEEEIRERERITSFILTERLLIYVVMQIATREERGARNELFDLIGILRANLAPPLTPP